MSNTNYIQDSIDCYINNLYYNRAFDKEVPWRGILVNNINRECLKDESDCKVKINRSDSFNQLVKEVGSFYVKPETISDGIIQFFRNNPNCASIKQWQRVAYHICREVGINITQEVTENMCNISFEINSNIISQECLLPFFVLEVIEDCKIDYSLSIRTKEECKIDYNLLHETTNCNLSFLEYSNLVDKNLTYNSIKDIYDNNLSVSIIDGKVSLNGSIDVYDNSTLSFDKDNLTYIGDRISALKSITEDLNLSLDIKKELGII